MLMKKFYTLAIAALVAVSSVSAAGFKQLSLGKDGMAKFNKTELSEKIALGTTKNSTALAPRILTSPTYPELIRGVMLQ